MTTREKPVHTAKQRATLRATTITSFMTAFIGSALNLTIPDIEAYYGVNATAVGWVVTIYMLAVAALSVPFGKLADTTGRRRVLLIGIAVFSLSSFATIFCPTFTLMLISRVLQGVGAAMIFSTNVAILIDAFSPKERGKILGIMTSAVYVGLAIGPVLGGILNHNFGWRSIFLFVGAVNIYVFISAYQKIERKEKLIAETSHDIWGSVLYVVMVTSLLYGLTEILNFGWIFMVIGVIATILFIRREVKFENPIVDLKIFRHDRAYTMGNVAALLNYCAIFATGYLVSIYLQVVLKCDSQTAGLLLIVQPVVMAFIAPVAGHKSDKHSPYIMSAVGMGITAVGLGFFVLITESSGVAWTGVALGIIGVGCGIFSSPNTNAVMSRVKGKDLSVASSILATMRSMGMAISMAIVTLIVGVMLGSATLSTIAPLQLITTVKVSFAIFTALCVIGVFICLVRGNTNRK